MKEEPTAFSDTSEVSEIITVRTRVTTLIVSGGVAVLGLGPGISQAVSHPIYKTTLWEPKNVPVYTRGN